MSDAYGRSCGMINKTIEELKQIHIHGRTMFTDGMVNLFWSGSGLDFLFDGTEISFSYKADFDKLEPWISVLVDGDLLIRMPVKKGKHTVSILRGMTPGNIHRIQILKDTQAMSEDFSHRLAICSLDYDGEIIAPPAFDLRMEFVGDSITSGEGFIGTKEEKDWVTALFTSVPTYGRITAEKLNADYRILSQSGWGIRSAWDNNIYCALPSYYDYICGLSGNRAAWEKNDFSSWNADVVVVNLGTNDASSFQNQPFYDHETDKSYQNRLLPDGSLHPEDVREIVKKQKVFLGKIRKYNPNAMIIWCYGMLGKTLSAALETGVKEFCSENGDEAAFYLELPEMTEETAGSRNHPGKKCHEMTAEILVDFITKNKAFKKREV